MEVDGILGGLDFEGIDQSLQLMMSVDTSHLNVVEELVLEQVSTVLTVKGLKSTACPGGGAILADLGSDGSHELLRGNRRGTCLCGVGRMVAAVSLRLSLVLMLLT